MSRVDFNGDGFSDILWRNDAGLVTQWLGTANNSFVPNANANSSVPLNWDVVGMADFNGDGLTDVLWRNDAGTVSSWLSTSHGGFAEGSSSEVPLSWAVEATGDFNGDHRDDVLWRNNNSGQLAEWLSQPDGSWVVNSAVASTVSLDWQVVGAGDFNGDGRDDIFWQAQNGLVADWLATPTGDFTLGRGTAAPFDSAAKGFGDFNGDGRDDVLWTSPNTGWVRLWLSEPDGGWKGEIKFGLPAGWDAAGTGQYGTYSDRDVGRDDIFLRSTNGDFVTWLMPESFSFLPYHQGTAGFVPTDWHVEIYDLSPWDY